MGLYVLPTGGGDPQSPHTEDEVYYVVSGRAKIRVADEDRAVKAGSIVYVAKNVEHRFHSIEEELTVLVFFAPAEYSNKKQPKLERLCFIIPGITSCLLILFRAQSISVCR
jgi:mannose-6-phosphate isomerase-like protein (cupin superfamily)